ncbi:ABC transporter substrate-binding protein, partial [Streptomyces albidoflavus]
MTHTDPHRRPGRAVRLPVLALLVLLALVAACGKEGSPPVKGPRADQLPDYR